MGKGRALRSAIGTGHPQYCQLWFFVFFFGRNLAFLSPVAAAGTKSRRGWLRVGQQHGQAINTHADPARRRHAI